MDYFSYFKSLVKVQQEELEDSFKPQLSISTTLVHQFLKLPTSNVSLLREGPFLRSYKDLLLKFEDYYIKHFRITKKQHYDKIYQGYVSFLRTKLEIKKFTFSDGTIEYYVTKFLPD